MSIATLPAERGTTSAAMPARNRPRAYPAHGPDAVVGPLRTTGAPAPLRRLPLPVLEPRAAVPLVDVDSGVAPQQQLLDLGLYFGTTPRRSADSGRSSATHDDERATEQAAAAAWATRFVLAAVEVAAGSRPTGQLVRWTTPEVQNLLERRAALAARLRRRSHDESALTRRRVRVRAVRCCPVKPGICEISAVVQEHDRTRAVAFRIEQFESRWRATAFELG